MLIALHDQIIRVECSPELERDISLMFRDHIVGTGRAQRVVSISRDEADRYTVSDEIESPVKDLSRGDVLTFVMDAVVRALVWDLSSAVAIHAGAVAWKGQSILLPGPSGSGKSSMTAWLVEQGFEYLTDEVAVLADGNRAVVGLGRAMVIKPGSAEHIATFDRFRDADAAQGGSHRMLRPSGDGADTAAGPNVCRLLVFPQFVAGAEISLEPLTSGQAALRLVACNLNARNLPDGGFAALSSLARTVPAIELRYGDFAQLEGVLDPLARLAFDSQWAPAEFRRFLSAFARSQPAPVSTTAAVKMYAVPAPTVRRGARKLTIGMATYDDYDGVYFTCQSIRLFHPEVTDDTEILVIDNHPDGPCSEALKQLDSKISGYRYMPMQERSGTAVRDFVFSEADGAYVMCVDSHVLIAPGAIKRLLDYYAANSDTHDLLQGPLVSDDLKGLLTHFQPEWGHGMYGRWGTDERAADPDAMPFDIPMQGLGLFSCRKTAWPGFNPKFRGFGGEEGYIHEKFRQAGGRVLCLPFLRWVHRFQRPMGIPYRNSWEDRVRNYIIGRHEFGLPIDDVRAHFAGLLGSGVVDRMITTIEAELGAA